MRKTMFLFVLFLCSVSHIVAQTKITINGKVKDSDFALPGVSVMVKGTDNGTTTDAEGNYNLSVNKGDILVFSYIGYSNQEITVGENTKIDVLMQSELQQLDEIVAIGYGTVKKSHLTGAISAVKGENIAKRNVTDVATALQGQIAGVHVSSNGGAPGSESSILIRGISTINGNSPLYVVDDVPTDDISWLNPKDIESVQALKDAASSAIFGSRAANGVILITTKQAKEGKTVISVDASYSIQQISKKPDLGNSLDYAKVANKAAENSGLDLPYPDLSTIGGGTDWWDEVTQMAPIENYSVSVNKGKEDFKISTSLSYYNQDGVVKGGGMNKITFKLNTEFKLTDRITIGENLNVSIDKKKNGPGLVWDAQRAEPNMEVYLPKYEQEGKNIYSIYAPTLRTDVANPMGVLARNQSKDKYIRTVGKLFAKVNILKGLDFESKFSIYLSSWENNSFSPDYYIEASDKSLINSVSRTHNLRLNYTWNNLLTYQKDFGKHSVNLLGGYIIESFEHRSLNGSGQKLPNNSKDLRYLDAATSGHWAGGTDSRNSLMSYVSRLNYAYDNRYLMSASFRADGSSRFSEDNRWGNFKSLSLAWVASEEEFIKNINEISQLKFRGSWGQVGNQNISNSATLTLIDNYYISKGNSGEVLVGTAPSTVGNADVQWETVEDYGFGLELGLFNQKITLVADYFNRKSKDLLMETSIPFYLGAAWSTPMTNIGELEAEGYELALNYNENIGKLSMKLGLNFSKASTEMTKLANGEAIFSGNHQRLDMLTKTALGQPAGSFFGYKTNGIFQNETEVNSYTDEFGNILQPQAKPGDMKFKDLNGDGRINEEDRTFIGNPEPDFSFGISLNLAYDNFDMSMLWSGSYGNDVLNAIKPYTHTGNGVYNSYSGILDDAWDGEGSTNSQPRLSVKDNNNNFRYSDYYIEDGSYIRLSSLQIGYSLPENLLKKVNISKTRFYVGGENLLTFTKFSGLDPDMGGSAMERGIDWGHYPTPRTFIAGINITF